MVTPGQRSSSGGVLEGRKSGVGHDQLKAARRTLNVGDDYDYASYDNLHVSACRS